MLPPVDKDCSCGTTKSTFLDSSMQRWQYHVLRIGEAKQCEVLSLRHSNWVRWESQAYQSGVFHKVGEPPFSSGKIIGENFYTTTYAFVALS